MSDQVYTLKYPLALGDEQITDITIPARLKAKHLRSMDRVEGEIGKMVELIAELAGAPVKVMNELDIDDMTALAEIIGGALGKFQATGETS